MNRAAGNNRCRAKTLNTCVYEPSTQRLGRYEWWCAGILTHSSAEVTPGVCQLRGWDFGGLEVRSEQEPVDRLTKVRIEASDVDADRGELRKVAPQSVARVRLLEAKRKSLNPHGVKRKGNICVLAQAQGQYARPGAKRSDDKDRARYGLREASLIFWSARMSIDGSVLTDARAVCPLVCIVTPSPLCPAARVSIAVWASRIRRHLRKVFSLIVAGEVREYTSAKSVQLSAWDANQAARRSLHGRLSHGRARPQSA